MKRKTSLYRVVAFIAFTTIELSPLVRSVTYVYPKSDYDHEDDTTLPANRSSVLYIYKYEQEEESPSEMINSLANHPSILSHHYYDKSTTTSTTDASIKQSSFKKYPYKKTQYISASKYEQQEHYELTTKNYEFNTTNDPITSIKVTKPFPPKKYIHRKINGSTNPTIKIHPNKNMSTVLSELNNFRSRTTTDSYVISTPNSKKYSSQYSGKPTQINTPAVSSNNFKKLFKHKSSSKNFVNSNDRNSYHTPESIESTTILTTSSIRHYPNDNNDASQKSSTESIIMQDEDNSPQQAEVLDDDDEESNDEVEDEVDDELNNEVDEELNNEVDDETDDLSDDESTEIINLNSNEDKTEKTPHSSAIKMLQKPLRFAYTSDLRQSASDGHKDIEDKDQTKPHKIGTGQRHKSGHHKSENQKNSKGYQSKHQSETIKKGHNEKENKKKEHSEKKGKKKSHQEDDGYYGQKNKHEKSETGFKYGETESYKKGHSTKGSHNVHKKDEFLRKHQFYDEQREGDKRNKYNHFHKGHVHKKGGKYDKYDKDGNYLVGLKGKKGKKVKSYKVHENMGHDIGNDNEQYVEHDEDYGSKGGNKKNSKWSYEKYAAVH